MNDPLRGQTVQAQSELLFYRIGEIRHRADVVNTKLQPDLVICLHFNAEGWGDPLRPEFVPRNHLHVLVNGCYSAGELRFDDQRYEMLLKLLNRSHAEELAASEHGGQRARHATTTAALRLHHRQRRPRRERAPYVWARNLLANRLYHAPVVFLEPYVMNSEPVWARVQAGDYDGEFSSRARRAAASIANTPTPSSRACASTTRRCVRRKNRHRRRARGF